MLARMLREGNLSAFFLVIKVWHSKKNSVGFWIEFIRGSYTMSRPLHPARPESGTLRMSYGILRDTRDNYEPLNACNPYIEYA